MIAGSTQVGSTLTAEKGSWTGSPTACTYAWSRCDQAGSSCADIVGASASSYKPAQVDAGNTLRVRVTAANSAGSTFVDLDADCGRAIPTADRRERCPTSGSGTIPVADVSPPARLTIDQQSLSPGVVTPGAAAIQLRACVTACNGRPVQGALIYATGVPTTSTRSHRRARRGRTVRSPSR